MLLLALILFPIFGGTLLLLLRSSSVTDRARESIGLAFAAATLLIGIICTYQVAQTISTAGPASIAPRIQYSPEWMRLDIPAALATNPGGWQLSLGLDGIGVSMVLLSSIVAIAVLVVARGTVSAHRGDYAAWILLATGGMLLVFSAMGLFSLSREGIGGATLQMFNHGITTLAMFLLLACMLVRRPHLRIDEHAGAMSTQFPRLGLFTVFFVVAAAGMPGLNSFVGELLALSGMLTRHPMVAGVAVLGVVLGPWYSFRMLQFVFFGASESASSKRRATRAQGSGQEIVATDLPFEHKAVFGSLALLCLFIGIMPNIALGLIKADVDRIANTYDSPAATASVGRSPDHALTWMLSGNGVPSRPIPQL